MELIVCRDAAHAKAAQRQIGGRADIRAIHPSPMALSGCAAKRITVCEGVDLTQDVGGEGSLEHLLRKRQATFGDEAVFVVL